MPKSVWLALPDGHQMGRVVSFLKASGLRVLGYDIDPATKAQTLWDRPTVAIPGVQIKVIRPQDMPLHVANQHFDLAVTGQDWLAEHLSAFPGSPARELVTIREGKVITIGAVVYGEFPAQNVAELRDLVQQGKLRYPFARVASEYVNLADRWAQERRIGRYRIVPTFGKTEAYLPQDADLLIENREEGTTLKRHGLRILEDYLESWPCVIGNTESLRDPEKRAALHTLLDAVTTPASTEATPLLREFQVGSAARA